MHPKYKRYRSMIVDGYNVDIKTAERLGLNSPATNSMWRAKSKFGLEYTLGRGNRIHFVLDKINMGAVVLKRDHYVEGNVVKSRDNHQGKAGHCDTKERNITYSELRWIYRHRHLALVRNGVQFWRTNDGQGGEKMVPCGPPWRERHRYTNGSGQENISWQQAWKLYVPMARNSPLSLK